MSEEGKEPKAVRLLRERELLPTEKDCDEIIAYIDTLTARLAAAEEEGKRLDWLQDIANEAVEIESFVGFTDPTRDRVFLDWADGGKRIASGVSLRAAIDTARAAQGGG